MDPVGGISSIDNLKAAGNENARMYIVPRSGHHGELSIRCLLLWPRLTCNPATSVFGQREGGEQATCEGAQSAIVLFRSLSRDLLPRVVDCLDISHSYPNAVFIFLNRTRVKEGKCRTMLIGQC